MALIDAPIVVIGAGRSGTSLLDAVLGAHPEITMFGEFGGSAQELWRLFWEISSAEVQRTRRIMAARRAAPEPPGTGDAEIFARVRDLERAERQRVAGIVRTALASLYTVADLPARHWGFKEIWAGAGDTADWRAMDAVFPEAAYLHIVRHPFDFARSAADWRRVAFTADQLQSDLAAWQRCYEANGERTRTGRYFRLTYEHLAAAPEAALAEFLSRLGLDWAPSCAAAAARRYVPSGPPSPLPPGLAAARDAVPGLAAAMAELGYALPIEAAAPAPDRALGAVSPRGAGIWRLNPPFLPDQGVAWTARLHLAPELAPLEQRADNLETPYRSPVALAEDGVALGPAHSLHALIRGEGCGRFSHWGPNQVLLFSTSDNSDPNRNGRVYTISA